MIVGNVVEELLSVESSTEEESEVSIRRFNDLGDEVDGFPSIERFLVRQSVLDPLRQNDVVPERVGDLGEERWVDVSVFPRRWSDGSWSRLFRRERRAWGGWEVVGRRWEGWKGRLLVGSSRDGAKGGGGVGIGSGGVGGEGGGTKVDGGGTSLKLTGHGTRAVDGVSTSCVTTVDGISTSEGRGRGGMTWGDGSKRREAGIDSREAWRTKTKRSELVVSLDLQNKEFEV